MHEAPANCGPIAYAVLGRGATESVHNETRSLGRL